MLGIVALLCCTKRGWNTETPRHLNSLPSKQHRWKKTTLDANWTHNWQQLEMSIQTKIKGHSLPICKKPRPWQFTERSVSTATPDFPSRSFLWDAIKLNPWHRNTRRKESEQLKTTGTSYNGTFHIYIIIQQHKCLFSLFNFSALDRPNYLLMNITQLVIYLKWNKENSNTCLHKPSYISGL